MDFVFTVCDKAGGEICPVWPGQPITAHWGLPDPVAVEGSEAVRETAFLETLIHMRRRIQLLLALPLASLDRMAIQREVKGIGTR
jgi:arsenate reductase